jgi:hypothetical protein
MRPYFEKTHHKKGLVDWLKSVGPEFKPQYQRKKKKFSRPQSQYSTEEDDNPNVSS